MEIDSLDLIARVATAVALGALIGLEREIRGQVAGLRTHALVATGAALFTMAGAYGFQDIARGDQVDPARVAAQVATGIGFIGAGAILKIGLTVRGLTTAATLWMAAALGVAAGSGAYLLAAVGAGAVLAVVVGLNLVKIPLANRATLTVAYEIGHGTLGRILAELENAHAEPGRLHLSDDFTEAGGRRTASIRVRIVDESHFEGVAAVLRELPEVTSVRWERPS